MSVYRLPNGTVLFMPETPAVADLTPNQLDNHIHSGLPGDAPFILDTTNAIKTFLDNSKIVNVLLKGALGNGVEEGTIFRTIFSTLADGSIVIIPKTAEGYLVEIATGAGANLVAQRASAVANGLKPILCTANNITVYITGDIKATNILGDIFSFTGDNVQVVGLGGSISGIGGADAVGFLDTNSTDTALQWLPSLITATGKYFTCEGMRFIDAPTVSINARGTDAKISKNIFIGGRVVHSDTTMFGVRINVTATNSVVIGNTFKPNALTGKTYSAIFNSGAAGLIATNNQMLGQHEHGVYNYGNKSIISNNYIDMLSVGIAAGIQVFAEYCNINNNTIDNANNGGISLQYGSDTDIIGNKIYNAGNSGIAVRTSADAIAGYVLTGLVIADNVIYFNGVLDRQGGIDIRVTRSLTHLKVTNNVVDGASANIGGNSFAGVNVETIDAPTHSIYYAEIASNNIGNCQGNAIYVNGLKYSLIKDNLLNDNSTSNLASQTYGIMEANSIATIIERNYSTDTRGAGKLTTHCVFETGTTSQNLVRDNVGLGLVTTPAYSVQAGTTSVNNLSTL